jgi:hypothetical protein
MLGGAAVGFGIHGASVTLFHRYCDPRVAVGMVV